MDRELQTLQHTPNTESDDLLVSSATREMPDTARMLGRPETLDKTSSNLMENTETDSNDILATYLDRLVRTESRLDKVETNQLDFFKLMESRIDTSEVELKDCMKQTESRLLERISSLEDIQKTQNAKTDSNYKELYSKIDAVHKDLSEKMEKMFEKMMESFNETQIQFSEVNEELGKLHTEILHLKRIDSWIFGFLALLVSGAVIA